MIIDTHIHIPLMINMTSQQLDAKYLASIEQIIQESAQADVFRMISIATSYHDSMQNIAIAEKFLPIYATVGIHPTEIYESVVTDITALRTIIAQQNSSAQKIVGIGECGIDRYHNHASVTQQKDVFRLQIELALQHNLPVIIHSRDAAEETLYCIDEFQNTSLRGIVHCFSYDYPIARDFIQKGFILGIGGTVTYPKNDMLRTVIREIGLQDFVLETDAPFLPPQPWRGKKNHPQYLAYIAEYIGQTRGISSHEVSQATTHNAQTLFPTIT